jgi:uncharacterized membrane protein
MVIGSAPARTVPSPLLVRAVWTAVVLLAIIGIGAAVGRMLNLGRGIGPPTTDPVEIGFARYPLLTMLHIVPGALFMVLGPLQFVRRIRSRHLRFHRWSGRLFVAAGALIGVSGLVMGVVMPIGGANETAATTFFALIFLVSLAQAVRQIRRGDVARHREWMLRAFAVGLAIATIRPIVGLFFALSTMSPREFFGIAFWLGFSSHLIAAEIWIHSTRPASRVRPGAVAAGVADLTGARSSI